MLHAGEDNFVIICKEQKMGHSGLIFCKQIRKKGRIAPGNGKDISGVSRGGWLARNSCHPAPLRYFSGSEKSVDSSFHGTKLCGYTEIVVKKHGPRSSSIVVFGACLKIRDSMFWICPMCEVMVSFPQNKGLHSLGSQEQSSIQGSQG